MKEEMKKDSSQVSEKFEMVAREMESLDNVIQELSNRLKPVQVIELSEGEGKERESEELCEVADSIDSLARRIRNIRKTIRSEIDRLKI
jgi:prefoldin subunit 5